MAHSSSRSYGLAAFATLLLVGVICGGLFMRSGESPASSKTEAGASLNASGAKFRDPEARDAAKQVAEPASEAINPRASRRESVSDAVQTREPEAAAHWLLVTDESGKGIANVDLSWSTLPDATSRLDWGPVEVRALIEAACFSSTDAQGRAAFENIPEGASTALSVIWASKPGLAPMYLGLERGATPEGQRLTLRQSRAGVARVLDRGDAAQEASVLQVGILVADARAMASRDVVAVHEGQSPVSAEEAVLAFVRASRTSERGLAPLAQGGFPTLVMATYEERRSPITLSTSSRPSVTLHISSGFFEASGRVTLAEGGALGQGARVLCLSSKAGDKQLLGQVAVADSGTWGPIQLPSAKSGRLEFRLLGGGVFSAPIERDYPSPGEPLIVNFDAEAGISQVVKVIDEEGQPIHPARVRISWYENDAWHFNEAWTEENGLAKVEGCKAPSVRAEAWAQGYQTTRREDMGIPRHDEPEIVMPRAARITGHVTFEGKPVENFTVIYWDGFAWDNQRISVRDALEGDFVIEDAPLGEVKLLASSPQHAESETITISTANTGADCVVQLKLQRGVPGKGQVVDGASGEPIPTAIVKVLTVSEATPLGARSEALAVDSEGRFRAEHLGAKAAQVGVSAEGFVSTNCEGAATGSGMAFGVIPLARHQGLKVVFDGPNPREVEDWWFMATGPTDIPYARLPVKGDLDFEGIAPGRYDFSLVPSSGADTIHYTVDLRSGEDWRVQLLWGGGVDLEVKALLGEGNDLLEGLGLDVHFVNWQGKTVLSSYTLPSNHELTIRDLHADQATVRLLSKTFATLGEAHIDLTGPGPHFLEVEARAPDLQVDVVGLPPSEFAGGWIATSAVGLGTKEDWNPLDTLGRVQTYKPPTEQVHVIFYHPDHGIQSEVFPITAGDPQRIELELQEMFPVSFEVLDTTQPVSGVFWQGLAAGTLSSMHRGRTDATGQTGEQLLGDGLYTVTLSRNGYWHVEHNIDITAPGGSQVLQLRRLGNLRLSVTNETGAPLAGATISLTSHEFGTSVQDWRIAGRLTAEAAQLTTDALGQASVVGIPHGQYSWTATSSTGAASSGTCSVPAGSWGELTIFVGE